MDLVDLLHWSPQCIEGLGSSVACCDLRYLRTCAVRCGIPAQEDIACLHGICQLYRILCCISCRVCLRIRTAIQFISNLIGFRIPLRMKHKIFRHLILIKVPGNRACRILVPTTEDIEFLLQFYGRLGQLGSCDDCLTGNTIWQSLSIFISGTSIQVIAYALYSGRIAPGDVQRIGQRFICEGQRCTLPGQRYRSLLLIAAIRNIHADDTVLILEVACGCNIEITVSISLICSVAVTQVHIGHVQSVHGKCHTGVGSHVDILVVLFPFYRLVIKSIDILYRSHIP